MRRAVLYALLLVACGRSERPNVLIVTIDTLRADAVGKGTPGIEAFLREATLFRRARTVAPLTLPAHVSMFTGLFPASHEIHDNVTEPLPPREKRRFPLLAEEFRDAGYSTAAFVASPVLAGTTGLGSGFDVYDCPASSDRSLDDGGSLAGEERVAAALDWIGRAPRGRPWFVWVHLYDPHAPYLPFAGDAKRAGTSGGDSMAALYAGEVRRADAAFERLVAAAGPNAVVVLVSDHGEGLGEHAELEHGPLCYGSTIDAVLALRAPGFRRGAADAGLRSVADVAPSLARLCGLFVRETDGRDLRGPPHGTLVSESLFTWRIHGWGQSFSVADGEFTLVESGPRLELFDVRRDPAEANPLPLAQPAYEKLDRALERFRASKARSGAGDLHGSTPPYGTDRRRVSGYLPRHENSLLLDPRAHLAAWAAMERVPATIRLCEDRRDPEPLHDALRLLSRLETEIPLSPRIPLYRAGVLAALAELTGDLRWREQAAWAQIAAIEKGYDRRTIRPAIDLAVAAGAPDALRALRCLCKRRALKLDADTARALEEAATTLGLDSGR